MNRRGLMKFLGIGAAAAAVSTTGILAESLPSGKSDDDIWIKDQCKHHLDDTGKYKFAPRDSEVYIARMSLSYKMNSSYSSLLEKEQAQKILEQEESKHEEAMRNWSSYRICGVKFKRLRGVTTRCPSCGGQASSDKDHGIVT